MSTEIKGRPVLRPAGNVALRQESIDNNRGAHPRKPTKKPPPSPPLKPSPALSLKLSPPSSQPSTPRPSLTKSPVLKLSSSPKLPSKKPSTSPSIIKPSPLHTHHHASPPNPPHIQSHSSPPILARDAMSSLDVNESTNVGMDGHATVDLGAASDPPVHTPLSSYHDLPEAAHTSGSLVSSSELIYDLDFVNDELITDAQTSTPPESYPAVPSRKGFSSKLKCAESSTLQRKLNPRISLSRSSSDNFQRGSARDVKASGSSKNPIFIGSHSLDDASLAHLVAAKKAAACELSAQRRLKVAEYGRKSGKAGRVAPDVPSQLPVMAEPQRCKFITAQSDPLYVAYHDQEWGIPVHDDRSLFELLILAGAQVELSWNTILHRRDAYRDAFCGYEPASVALFNEKHIQSLEADKTLSMPGGKIRGVVENAQRILEVVEEFGSLDKYLWSFLNNRPMINSYRYPKQVPVKTSKSEFISKDLVKRGFRFVGPTIVYSFMQAAGMTNDHLVQCFRYHACTVQFTPFHYAFEEENGVECDAALSHMDADQAKPKQLLCAHDRHTQHQGQEFNHPGIVHI